MFDCLPEQGCWLGPLKFYSKITCQCEWLSLCGLWCKDFVISDAEWNRGLFYESAEPGLAFILPLMPDPLAGFKNAKCQEGEREKGRERKEEASTGMRGSQGKGRSWLMYSWNRATDWLRLSLIRTANMDYISEIQWIHIWCCLLMFLEWISVSWYLLWSHPSSLSNVITGLYAFFLSVCQYLLTAFCVVNFCYYICYKHHNIKSFSVFFLFFIALNFLCFVCDWTV